MFDPFGEAVTTYGQYGNFRSKIPDIKTRKQVDIFSKHNHWTLWNHLQKIRWSILKGSGLLKTHCATPAGAQSVLQRGSLESGWSALTPPLPVPWRLQNHPLSPVIRTAKEMMMMQTLEEWERCNQRHQWPFCDQAKCMLTIATILSSLRFKSKGWNNFHIIITRISVGFPPKIWRMK